MTDANNPGTVDVLSVSRDDATRFLENAVRNWSHVPRLSNDDLDDVAGALQQFAAKQITAALSRPEARSEEGLTVADAWQDLVDKDDRTSPEEYPDMALITREELADYMQAASPSPSQSVEKLREEEEARKLVRELRSQFPPDGKLVLRAIATIEALSATEQQSVETEALRALVDHNDALRSAYKVAEREGKDTNWRTLRGGIMWALAEHHDTVNAARAALLDTPKSEGEVDRG